MHLHRYLAEFDFHYSNRVALGVGDRESTDLAIKGAARKRLTYRQSNETRSAQAGPPLPEMAGETAQAKFVKFWRTKGMYS
jgi:hypothetical protein